MLYSALKISQRGLFCIPRARSISWAGISLDAALRFFYYSDVYCLMREGVSDLHCMSDAYLEEELEMEYQLKGSLFPLHRQISRSIETLIFSLTNGFRGSMIISNDNFI